MSFTRRQIAKLTALVAAGGSVLLGWVVDAFDLDIPTDDGVRTEGTVREGDTSFDLPAPRKAGDKRVATAIRDRRSRREYRSEPLTPAELGQLLWAAQGISRRRPTGVDFRTAPSAGATYPLEIFVVVGEPGVTDFGAGIYQYDPHGHSLELIESGNFQSELKTAALDQDWVQEAALDIVITGIDERTTRRYGDRGRLRYVPMEAGHVGENVYLQSESLGLSTVAIGAFRDEAVRNLLDVPENHRPLYIYPVGRRVRP